VGCRNPTCSAPALAASSVIELSVQQILVIYSNRPYLKDHSGTAPTLCTFAVARKSCEANPIRDCTYHGEHCRKILVNQRMIANFDFVGHCSSHESTRNSDAPVAAASRLCGNMLFLALLLSGENAGPATG